MVASLPRTGSTLLCRALWQTRRVGAPKEYLNPMQLRDWAVRPDLHGPAWRLLHRPLTGPLQGAVGRGWSRGRLLRHLEQVRARRTGPTGWFGLKLHHHHLQRWFGDDPITEALGPIRWILLTREDRVAQAVSWARALQTGQWASSQRPWMRPLYSRRRIQRCMDGIAASQAAWETALAGEPVLRLTYEQVSDDLQGAVQAVFDHLDAGSAPRVTADFTRQADAVSADWIRRFGR